jgi:excisionase family DNA binding protein
VTLLSVSEVARLLGVCSATVYALCAKGALPHVRVLNAIRVTPGDLEAFVENRRPSQR